MRILLGRKNRLLRRHRPHRSLTKRINHARTFLHAAIRPAGFVLFTLLVAFGIAQLGRYALTSPRFAVKTLRFEGTRRTTPEDLRGRTGLAPGSNIFRSSLTDIARDVQSSPWVRAATARRQLPATIVIEVEEYEPQALVLLGHLYLVDREGHIFKRATPEETLDLPVVTGMNRIEYTNDRASCEIRLRDALVWVNAYRQERRPRLGEIHLEPAGPPTLYTRDGGIQLRLGDEGSLGDRLARLDRVWGALGPETARARAIYVGNGSREDRVTVRMTPAGTP